MVGGIGSAHDGTAPSNKERDLHALRKVFATFDKDGSGTIDVVELKACLKAMGQRPTPLELQELLSQMDTDGNGVIDFDEFAAVMIDNEQVHFKAYLSLYKQ